MGGSGGAVFFDPRSKISDFQRRLRESELKTRDEGYEQELAGRINELLVQYNDRDVDKIGTYLETIREALQEDIEGTIDLRFGGSIQKHTYVDGLSDIDCLVLLKDPELESLSPKDVLDYFKSKLEDQLKNVETISIGNLATTIRYEDGTEIQLLPAIRKGAGYVISTAGGERWSSIIRPQKFAEALTKVNQECGGKAVPTIKLVKAALANLPERYKLTGYHIESLAIEVFKTYQGPRTTKQMLEYFFEKAKDLVLKPIKDKTGQSLNVDDYLGPQNSSPRQAVSTEMNRISRRMKNADAARLSSEWLRTIGE
jgi:hypothetical protein